MVWPIWIRFLGVAWLVASFFLVGSTIAQSPLGRPWAASRPFPWSWADPWLLVLLGHAIPFWKAFDELGFDFGPRLWWVGYEGGKGVIFLKIGLFLENRLHLKLNSKRCIFLCFLIWGPIRYQGWVGLSVHPCFNFWTDRPIGLQYSGVAWLVVNNF